MVSVLSCCSGGPNCNAEAMPCTGPCCPTSSQHSISPVAAEAPEALTPWYYAYRDEFMRLLRFSDHETLDQPLAGWGRGAGRGPGMWVTVCSCLLSTPDLTSFGAMCIALPQHPHAASRPPSKIDCHNQAAGSNRYLMLALARAALLMPKLLPFLPPPWLLLLLWHQVSWWYQQTPPQLYSTWRRCWQGCSRPLL
jgi:hypothetical protein